nr:MAG TPA: hypothetical protein [Caudoviricetes sp.]
MRRGFWLYMVFATAGCILLLIASYVGWFFFHLSRSISPSGEQWGQFGDFFGGVLNPILSFITICILIKTSIYQEKHNSVLERRERIKRFEDRFYGMMGQVKNNFDNLTMSLNGVEKIDGRKILKNMEDAIFSHKENEFLNTHDFKENIFPVVRQFYLLLKVLETEYARGDISEESLIEYNLWLINSTDYDILRLVILSSYYYDTIQASKFIVGNERFIGEVKRLGFGKYIEAIINFKSI